MPTISVFIRKDDLDKFKALPNKSEFLHNALNHTALTHIQELVNKHPILEKHIDKQKLDEAVAFEPLYRDKKNKKL